MVEGEGGDDDVKPRRLGVACKLFQVALHQADGAGRGQQGLKRRGRLVERRGRGVDAGEGTEREGRRRGRERGARVRAVAAAEVEEVEPRPPAKPRLQQLPQRAKELGVLHEVGRHQLGVQAPARGGRVGWLVGGSVGGACQEGRRGPPSGGLVAIGPQSCS